MLKIDSYISSIVDWCPHLPISLLAYAIETIELAVVFLMSQEDHIKSFISLSLFLIIIIYDRRGKALQQLYAFH